MDFIFLNIVDFEGDSNIFWNTQNAPDCTILIERFRGSMPPEPPWHESESTSLQGYLRAWYVIFDVKKGKQSIFYLYLARPPPLVKCECIHFFTNVCIWIDLGEKYVTKFGLLLIYYPKNC